MYFQPIPKPKHRKKGRHNPYQLSGVKLRRQNERIIARARGYCEMCGRWCGDAFEVHHVDYPRRLDCAMMKLFCCRECHNAIQRHNRVWDRREGGYISTGSKRACQAACIERIWDRSLGE